MKKVWSKGIVMVLVGLFVSVFSINTSKAQGSVSLQVFYDELQPYGTWMDHSSHGYVWIPRVDRSFTPYATNGYWINTEYGNTWVSDYSWGWAPFHYGRWFYDNFYGWIWVPDTEWAPAWVAWRGGGGYYGWAPLMPGFGMHVSFNYYNRIPHHYWNFVPYRYITYRTVYRHCVPRTHVVNIIHNTTIVTHNYTDNRRRTYFTGPSRGEMERTGRERVDVYRISDRNRPGRSDIDRGSVSFYKPEIDNSRDARTRSVPSRFMKDNGNGKMVQVESRRETTSEFQRDMNKDVLPKRSEQNSLQREERSPAEDRNLYLERNEVKRNDLRRDVIQPQRSQEPDKENDALQRIERERQNFNREEQQNFNQRREQLERQNAPIRSVPSEQNNQRQREQLTQPGNDLRRTPAQQPQRLPQIERQNEDRLQNGSGPREQNSKPREQFKQNDVRRTPGQQPNNVQQIERQNNSRLSQPNQNYERQRSTVTPNNNRSATPQREQQIQRSTSQQQQKQPARSTGGSRESSPRKRN